MRFRNNAFLKLINNENDSFYGWKNIKFFLIKIGYENEKINKNKINKIYRAFFT